MKTDPDNLIENIMNDSYAYLYMGLIVCSSSQHSFCLVTEQFCWVTDSRLVINASQFI